MDGSVTEGQLKVIIEKLDAIRLELLRIRSILLPEKEASEEERKEIEGGLSTDLEDLIKGLSKVDRLR